MLEDRRLLSTFEVTSTADDGSTGTLRWAVAQANASTTPSTIEFSLGASPSTITLAQGEFELTNTTQPISIQPNAGQGMVTIDAGHASRVFQVDAEVTATISGITITGGSSSDYGGGLENLGVLTLSNCTISGNTAGSGGGGLYNEGPSATIESCLFTSNSASTVDSAVFGRGGGIQNSSGTMIVSDSTFTGNEAFNGGGIDSEGILTVGHSSFSGNIASSTVTYTAQGAGIYSSGTLNLDTTILVGNKVDNLGGGLANTGMCAIDGCTFGDNITTSTHHFAAGGGVYNTGSLSVLRTTFYGNQANDSGGGMYNGGTLTASESTFSGNAATLADGVGGGLVNASFDTSTITDSTFEGNTAEEDGGGLYNQNGDLALTNVTISGNSAVTNGGGLYNPGGAATLTNTIVAGNTLTDSTASDIVSSYPSTVTGIYNLIGIGGSDGIANGTQGNIVLTSLDGLGLLPLADNGGPTQTMAILSTSPALGAGTAVGGLTTDQRNEPLDTPNPDIGAFQAQPAEQVPFAFPTVASPSITFGAAQVTFTGVIKSGVGTPTGEKVSVKLGGVTQLATIQADGSFSSTFSTASLAASGSAYPVSYSYTSDGTYPSVGATGSLAIARATPAVSVADAGGTFSGAAFTAAGSVAGVEGSAAPSIPTLSYYAGTYTGAGELASLTPLPGAPSAAGSYTVLASYPGSADYIPASALASFTIAQATPTISLGSSGGSAVHGQAIVLTATVASGAGTPGGSVTFVDGGTVLGTVALDGSGHATFTTSGLGIGSHSIRAIYGGDSNFQATTSGAAPESVGQAATHLVLTPHSVKKRKKLVSILLDARIDPLGPGAGVPGGTVRFMYKKKTIGTAAVIGGHATLTVKASTYLKKSLTIIYSGDPDFQGDTETSPKLTQKSLQA